MSFVIVGGCLTEYLGDEEEVVVPAGVRVIGCWAFVGRVGISRVILPPGVVRIDAEAFAGCSSLREISLPAGLLAIGWGAFAGCSALADIAIPESVRAIGSGAFRDTAYYNDPANWQDGLLYIGGVLIEAAGVSGDCRLLPATRLIANCAFWECEGLTDIVIPGSVEAIGVSAFGYCRRLENAVVEEGVARIGAGAFYRCVGLKKLTLPPSVTEIGEGAFADCRALRELLLPPGIKRIAAGACVRCRSLRAASVLDTVESVGEFAFRGCGFPRVTVPPNVRRVEGFCFGGIKDIVIYDTLGGAVDRIGCLHESGRDYAYTVTVLSAAAGGRTGVVPMYGDGTAELDALLKQAWGEGNTFDYRTLDAYFPGVAKAESKTQIAITRLRWPFDLSAQAAEAYAAWLRANAADILRRCVDEEDMELTAFFADKGLIGQNAAEEVIEYAVRKKKVAFTAFLLQHSETAADAVPPDLELTELL
ncbi:MAG: leucine-rich repeat protein [Firmicutes bacterium]|nr:leucine-rich repeat protein [Bacillota bacterium]